MADEQQVCPNCGNFNRAGARFCSKCGHVFKPSAVPASPATAAPPPNPVPKPTATPASPASVIPCPDCGKEVGSDTRFCRHCGHPLGAAQTTAPQSATVPAAPLSTGHATPAPATPGATVTAGDDDMTQPLGAKSAPPLPSAAAKAAPQPPAGADRGAPAWLWAMVGLLLGILLGAGIVLAAPGFVGLERIAASDGTPAVPATDVVTPGSPADIETATPFDLPAATTEVGVPATPEASPAAAEIAIPTPEVVSTTTAPPDEAAASPTTAADAATSVPPDEAEASPDEVTEVATEAADATTPQSLSTSTPLAP